MPLLDCVLPELPPKRRSIRLKDYDYAQLGAYFVTIVTQDRRRHWGEANTGKVQLNDLGQIVARCWEDIPAHFPHVCVDIYCVMPNHLHGILMFTANRRGTTCRAPTAETERFAQPVSGSLPTVVRSFKAAVTKRVRRTTNKRDIQVWQRGFYEHVIRNERELERVREYITNNPLRWDEDAENPDVVAKGK